MNTICTSQGRQQQGGAQRSRNHIGPRGERGTNLIEVMVAVAILSIGLLGLAMLQLQGLKNNTDAYLRTQATFLANEFIERLRVNASVAANYTGTAPTAPTKDCQIARCTKIETADFDLYWFTQALNIATSPETGLPGGSYTLDPVTGNKYMLTISWTEQIGAEGSENRPSLTISQSWEIDL